MFVNLIVLAFKLILIFVLIKIIPTINSAINFITTKFSTVKTKLANAIISENVIIFMKAIIGIELFNHSFCLKHF